MHRLLLPDMLNTPPIVSCPHWSYRSDSSGRCALKKFRNPSLATCYVCLKKTAEADGTPVPPMVIATPPAPSLKIEGVQDIMDILTGDKEGPFPYPWCADIKTSYDASVAAAGGSTCKGCTLNGIKNKFARLVSDQLKTVHAST